MGVGVVVGFGWNESAPMWLRFGGHQLVVNLIKDFPKQRPRF